MKKLFFIILMILPVIVSAQMLADDSSYATNDTTSWIDVTGGGNKILKVFFQDSVNVKIQLDFVNTLVAQSYATTTSATVFQTYAAEADSTNSTAAAGFAKGYVLRFGATNNIPGINKARLRITRLTTRNGTTTPLYRASISDY